MDAVKMLTTLEVCHRLSISLKSLASLIKRGDFPRPIKVTKDCVWPETDVIAVLHLRARGMWRRKKPKKKASGEARPAANRQKKLSADDE